MTFTSKVCTVEKSCQVRRVKAVQDLSLKLGYGAADDTLSGKLSPSSGEESAWIVRNKHLSCEIITHRGR